MGRRCECGFALAAHASGITHHAPHVAPCAGFAPSSGSFASPAGSADCFSCADSAASLTFIAPTKRPVKSPPLSRVLRKNSQVCGQPAVPLVRAIIQPAKVLVYSGLWNGLKNHAAVLVMR